MSALAIPRLTQIGRLPEPFVEQSGVWSPDQPKPPGSSIHVHTSNASTVYQRGDIGAHTKDFPLLDSVYVFENRRSVVEFFTEHRAVESLLLQAREALDRCFGQQATKTLKLVFDDEGGETL